MDILFISHDACFGGAQYVLINILKWLKENTQFRLGLLILNLGTGAMLQKFAEICPIHTELPRDLIAKTKLIYGNTIISSKIYNEIKNIKKNIYIITHLHELGMSINYYAKDLVKDMLEYTDEFIACSDAVEQFLIGEYSVKKVTTVYASILPTDFSTPNHMEKIYLRNKFGIENNFCVVGCGIGLAYRKGIDLFINISKQLPHIDFYWIGDFNKSEKIENTTYGELNMDNKNLHILGFIENAKTILSLCDVFLLTSREDPFPLVCLEAAQYSLPIICLNNSGGIPNLISRAKCGIISENITDIVQNIILLEKNAEHRKELGERGKKYILNNYTFDKTTPKIVEILGEKIGYTVNIILPNYNHSKYLLDRLNSIKAQTYTNWALTIIDDGSTDNSVEIIENFLDANRNIPIKFIKAQKNSGSAFKIWAQALSDLVIQNNHLFWIAESDDVSHPNFLENLIHHFKNPAIKIAYCDSHIINTRGEIIGNYLETDYLKDLSQTKWNDDYINTEEEEIISALGVKNTILNASSVIFRLNSYTENLDKILNSMKLAGDWFFYLYLLCENGDEKNNKIAYSTKRYNYHRRHEESIFGQLGKRERREKFKTLFSEIQTIHNYVLKKRPFDFNLREKIYKYLSKQYENLNLDLPVDYFYPINVGILSIYEIEGKEVDEVLKLTGNNTGNLLFSKVGRDLFLGKKGDLSDNVDILCFIASNWLSEKTDLQFFADLIRKKNIPCICMGLGAQNKDTKTIPILQEGTIDFLKEVSKRTPYILVRGKYSLQVCEHYGVKNVKIGGCPSIFYNTDLQLGEKLEKKYLACQENFKNFENFENLKVLYNMDLNENIEIKKNFHHILQNEKIIMKLSKGENVDTPSREYILKKMGVDENYIQKYFHFFTNIEEWSKFIQTNNFDLSIGNRIHGTIMCIENYLPAYCQIIDTRTQELCHTLKIPYYYNTNDNNYISQFNGKEFDLNRQFLAALYKDLFQKICLFPSDILLKFCIA